MNFLIKCVKVSKFLFAGKMKSCPGDEMLSIFSLIFFCYKTSMGGGGGGIVLIWSIAMILFWLLTFSQLIKSMAK